jgi:hypothetical protein
MKRSARGTLDTPKLFRHAASLSPPLPPKKNLLNKWPAKEVSRPDENQFAYDIIDLLWALPPACA